MKLNKNSAARQIADDWLLLYPNTYKADLISALSKVDDKSFEEIFSFHERIAAFPDDQKRHVLSELPKDQRAVIEEMLEGYTSAIRRANEDYYNSDTPSL